MSFSLDFPWSIAPSQGLHATFPVVGRKPGLRSPWVPVQGLQDRHQGLHPQTPCCHLPGPLLSKPFPEDFPHPARVSYSLQASSPHSRDSDCCVPPPAPAAPQTPLQTPLRLPLLGFHCLQLPPGSGQCSLGHRHHCPSLPCFLLAQDPLLLAQNSGIPGLSLSLAQERQHPATSQLGLVSGLPSNTLFSSSRAACTP